MLPCGLNNVGNTCFLNTALQCLYRCKDFRTTLQNNVERSRNAKQKHHHHVYKALSSLFENMNTKTVETPTHLIHSIQNCVRSKSTCGGNQFACLTIQHDTSEFFIYLLDVLHQALENTVLIEIKGVAKSVDEKQTIDAMKQFKSFFTNNYSQIVSLFFSQYQSSIHNTLTNEFSYSYDPFNTIQIDMPKVDKNSNLSLYDCFNKFTEIEKIETDKSVLHKRLRFKTLSKYIIIVLKRFSATLQKRNDQIDIPLELDLREYCVGADKYNNAYSLIAVANHKGRVVGGHYYAYVKDEDSDMWYICNDSQVRQLHDIKSISSPFAYCLFYEKIEKK